MSNDWGDSDPSNYKIDLLSDFLPLTCSLSKWFVNLLILIRKVENYLYPCTYYNSSMTVNFKLLSSRTVSAHLISPGIVLLLPEPRLVSELVYSSSVSIHGKSQTAGDLSPSWWPSLPLHLPTANWKCFSCCQSSEWECEIRFPSACWAWACASSHDHRSTVLHPSDLRATFPTGLKSWSWAF